MSSLPERLATTIEPGSYSTRWVVGRVRTMTANTSNKRRSKTMFPQVRSVVLECSWLPSELD
jgi:hypothetical protein